MTMPSIRLHTVFGAVAAALLAACSEAPPPAVPEPASAVIQGTELRYPSGHPQLTLLKAVEVRPSTAVAIELPARLIWNEARTQRIYAPLAGRVTAIRADVGQAVKAGTVLASLASPDLGQAQADAARAGVDMQLATKTLKRQRELLDAGVLARKEYDQAEADLARAQAEATRTEARTRLYGGGTGVNQQLAITAGINGVVVERNLNPGQELRPDQSGVGVPALFVVSDPTTLWVQIDARESDLGSLKTGANFDLIVPSLNNEKFTGKVVAQADAIDPATRTIKVRGEIANPDRRLKAEMLANARLERHLGGGLVVPSSAIVLRNGQHVVFVQTGPGFFEPHEVKLSWQDSKQAVIARGLEVGDKVIAENTLLLARQFALSQDKAEGDETVAPDKTSAANGTKSGTVATADKKDNGKKP
ncbi:efflux RND transporter periplasmic adaptor subunit [Casimicrobium huifangae]|uniref:efflux RND transporter periplasmic adaptor subunit n=1 Tax=Casimicrobium huifangae TaxID=2591109 RepID=UPI003783394D